MKVYESPVKLEPVAKYLKQVNTNSVLSVFWDTWQCYHTKFDRSVDGYLFHLPTGTADKQHWRL
jgi:hypothetical protein